MVSPKHFGRQSIGLALFGCKNRPVYQICVFPDKSLGRRYEGSIIEQVGVYDPLPNAKNEKLVSLNYGRLKYWIGQRNAEVSVPVLELLGLAGFYPIHPRTYIRAKENTLILAQKLKEAQEAASEKQKEEDGQNEEQVDEKKSAPGNQA